MAKYNLEKYTAADGLGFPLNFRRGNPNPLDNSSVWSSYEAAKNYAETDTTAYVGQILSVVDNTDGVVTVYSIQNEAGALEKVGTSPVGDESTITVAANGTVSLYGISGLPLTRQEEDGSETKITYQPLYVDGKLTWVEPSATTVEGLASEIEGLKTRLGTIESTIGDAEAGLVKDVADNAAAIDAVNEKIGTVTDGKTVVEMIADVKAEATYDDSDVIERLDVIEGDYLKQADKTELANAIGTAKSEIIGTADDASSADTIKAAKKYTDEKLSALLDGASDTTLDSISELAKAIKDNDSAIDALNDIAGSKASQADLNKANEEISAIKEDYLKSEDKTELQDNIDALGALIGELPEGLTSTTVVGYVGELAESLNSLESRVSDVEDGINALVEAGVEKNAIASVDEAELAISADRKLSITAIDQAKVTGLTDIAGNETTIADLLDSKVNKNGTDRLITEDEAKKLAALVIGDSGAVEISGKVNAENVVGLEAMLNGKVDKVDDMGLSANNFTDALLEKLNGIEAGAQANDIEAIKLPGMNEALAIVSKVVEIPFASLENPGVVKLSSEIGIDENNALEVKSINVNKLVQTDGDVLVLDGGNSSAK